MLSVIQLVSSASVHIKGQTSSSHSIGEGLVVYLGISNDDTEKEANVVADKISKLRIFQDKEDKMNLSILDKGGEILLISQFTLYGSLKGNNRPSFSNASGKEKAIHLYNYTLDLFSKKGIPVKSGFFGEHMVVSQVNDGPVTIILDTQDL